MLAEIGRRPDELLAVLADPAVPDAEAGRLIRQRIGMPRRIAARRPIEERALASCNGQ